MTDAAPWPQGGGEMGELIRSRDWAATPLGPIDGWSVELKLAASLVLENPFPTALVWGPGFTTIYNDAFRPILGAKAEALGRSFADIWREAWHEIGPIAERAFAGEATFIEDYPLVIDRSGAPEQAYFTFSYSPIRASDGSVLGMIDTVIETTDKVRTCKASRESEERFRALVTAGTYSIYRMSPDWRFMHQLDSESLANTSEAIEDWGDKYILEDDRPRVFAAIEQAIRTKSLFELEHRVRVADGSIGWVLSRAVPIFDAEGEIAEWFGAASIVTERKRAEEALRESEERYRTLFESMDEAYAVVEVLGDEEGRWADFRFLDVNPAFMHHTAMPYPVGKTATELLGTPNPRWAELYGQVLDTGSPLRVEETEFTLGRTFDLNIFELDRERNRVAVLFTNITDRKRAETALRENEERYRLIVENATDYAIIISDPDDVIVEWLPGAEAVFGWTREEAIGRPGDITFTPQDQAEGEREREIETAAREGSAPDVRWHWRKDGSQVFIEGTVTPLRNEDGSIRGYLKIGQDVSERRNAQEALEASERRMRSLVTGIPQLVFRSMSDGCRVWGSPQWIEYTGLSFEESLGLGWLEAVHPDDRELTLAAWEGVEERGEYYVEHRIRHAATGEYCWHQTRATPLRDEQGRILEWLGTSNDVEELRRLQRHQQMLLAELQHRVRNTLGIVRSIARRTAATSDNLEEMAGHLEGRLGALSRVQAAVTRNPEAGVDLAGLVEDELLAYAAREGEALRINGEDVSLKPRPAESISLAIHELATNAVKYGALGCERGRIDIRWRRSKLDGTEWLDLVWEENGVDMPAEPPQRQGFGLELLTRTLPFDLRAETNVEFRREGLRFTMAVPLGPDVLAE